MSSSLAPKAIIPQLRELAELEVPSISEAADAVVLLCRAVKRVKSDEDLFEDLSTKAAKLLYVVINGLREKGQSDLDNNSKSNIDAFTGVVEKFLDLALKNSTRSDFIAFWSSDEDEIEVLRGELDARLRAFGFKSFDDLRVEHKQRVSQPGNKSEKPKNINGSNVAKPPMPPSYPTKPIPAAY
ncbi:hypothetical protein M378DRAFT_171046 [Amanita muscaria Koide BX008]|uniref:Uncharacterized protein n=1 Tax=Amanita muscaria (strain Koide BX008) TaxID=946122 RepID=A0A0C2SVJ1_AMAMK|nr:hypothetical protein M378DRAFT_171046 [Amanita muscaria Koide BX008]